MSKSKKLLAVALIVTLLSACASEGQPVRRQVRRDPFPPDRVTIRLDNVTCIDGYINDHCLGFNN